MKRKSLVFTTILVLLQFCCSTIWARPTTAYQAEKVVKGWLKTDPQPLDTALGGQVRRVETFTNDSGELIYYIVYLQPSGFVIVPADDLIDPIIGFVETGSYNPSPENPLGALVTNDLKGRIEAVRDVQRLQASAVMKMAVKSQAKWARLEGLVGQLLSDSNGLTDINDVRVAPLVQTKWGQTLSLVGNACYNYYTPLSDPCDPCDYADPCQYTGVPKTYGDPNNYPCGCVATAMAQLMRFHKYANEPNGVGKLPWHTIWVNGIPEQAWMRGSDGLGGPYDWDLMTLVPDCNTPEPNRQAIGALCYDAGVSVYMNYSPTSSGAWLIDAAIALRDVNIFNYSNAVCGSNTVTAGDIGEGLNGMVNPNLDYGHPVILSIASTPGDGYAHAIVVDGYGYELSTLYHHLNMGKQGNSDAWYNLPNVGSYIMVRGCVYNVFTSGSGEIISGRVTNAYRNPVSDVNVTAQRTGGGTYVATTNNSGIYALAHVPSASAYTITAAKSGYSFVPANVNTGTSQDLNSVSGNVWGVDFREVPPFVYVDANATGNNDGMNWHDAFNYLQDGLANVWTDAILVADGIYKPDQGAGITPGDRNATFQLINGVTIYGGYAGVGAPDPCARDIQAYETILSGDIGTVDNKADNSYHVVTGDGTDSTAILDGFTITAGNADGTFPDSAGGGIFCWSSGSPTITHCNITGNFALLGGGICCNDSSNASISYCTISGNTGAAWGGGIVFANGTPSISHSTITGNWANRGGGIFCMDDGPQITHCTITRCTISSNRAVIVPPDIGGIGGGISCDGWSDTTISNCIFWSNSAPTGPEIALEFDCNLTVSYTKVQGEQAAAYVEGSCTLNWGIGNTNADPCFADSGYWDTNGTPADANDDFWVNGDYHLKSQAGRWDPNSKSWVNDPVTSPCIDLGNPGCPLSDEPNDANNVRINMGAYGGTTEASKTPAGWSLLADLTNDGTVDFKDFAWQAKDWLDSESEQQGDLDRDGTVDVRDLALFVEHWLEQTIWHEL